MLRSWQFRCALIFFSCSFIGLAHANSEPPKSDSLQSYRDEIKQSETNASQAVLDALQANTDTDNSSQQNQTAPGTSATTSKPRSNNDKAFIPLDKSANSSNPPNKNPWLQPNPWAKQPPNIWEKNAKLNPYSNAPIPGPTPPSNVAIPSPPNIFAPSPPSSNTSNLQSNAHS
ncbi:hypothetical protein [Rickettsiella endosymbiont of Rhagonycha lignosa]|uniref:hypothetical protein n=1 Tax=Rickettsiella endosymbiont of Rhagonycha lignosa TaxID=3077937 RepID=UPI00313C5365